MEKGGDRMSDSLIGDIRAVNFWNWFEPEWDGVTLPRPKKELLVTHYELQVRRVVVSPEGLPTLTDWQSIQTYDHYPEGTKAE
jgi:hypothetical protein